MLVVHDLTCRRYHIRMKRKDTKPKAKSDWKSVEAAVHKSLQGDNIIMGNAAKPISLHPLKLEDAVSALLKVKPEPKPAKSKD